MTYKGKAQCICGTAIEILGIRPAIVDDEDHSAVCQKAEEAMADVIGKAALAIAIPDGKANERLGLDTEAHRLVQEIYKILGLVVEEIPDCIPDPEGGFMKA